MKHLIFAFAIIIGLTSAINAQDKPNGSIHLIAKNTGDKIVLRWAPSSVGVWDLSNKAGYQLERLSFKDSTDFFDASFKTLTAEPLKPWPIEKWEPIANEAAHDRYAAIAAQMIHGNNDTDKGDFLAQAEQYKNLYSMALLAADFSANAATASGLRYEDNDVNTQSNYIYRLYSLGASKDYPIDTVYLVVNGDDLYQEPKIELRPPFENENAIALQWDRALEDDFTAWFIEKSFDNGHTFKRLNDAPYIDSPAEGKPIPETISYIDSVDQNYVKYQYRIIGIDAFGDYSKPSNVISAMGRDRTPPAAPTHIEANQIANGQMKITWDAPDDKDLDGFYVTRQNQANGVETKLTKKMLSKNTRTFVDTDYSPIENNWYLVYAVDTAGNAMMGLPQYGTITDSIPPSAPKGLTGTIDTNGVVTLKWDAGTEIDLFGYSVFYAHQEDHVFVNANNHPFQSNTFTDTIDISTLTENIYYRVVAFDMARNASEFSEMLTLKKPDIVPPIAPLFTDYKVTKDGIQLTWANSSSKDAKIHYLFRKEKNETNWKVIHRTTDHQHYGHYVDDATTPGTEYQYKLEAEDNDGLKTSSEFVLNLKAIDYNLPTPVKSLTVNHNKAQKNIQVKWDYPKQGDFKFALYRAVDGKGFQLVKPLDSNIHQYTDTNIKSKKTYEYMVKVVFANGSKSGFSPIEKIQVL